MRGGVYLHAIPTTNDVTLVGCRFSENTVTVTTRSEGGDVTVDGGDFAIESACGPGLFNEGSGTLDCFGCDSEVPLIKDLFGECVTCSLGAYNVRGASFFARYFLYRPDHYSQISSCNAALC